MAIATEDRARLVRDFRRGETDTGSPEVQVSLLTARIDALSQHLKDHDKDNHSRRGLLLMVGKRNRLLRYLQRVDGERYQALIKRLGLRK